MSAFNFVALTDACPADDGWGCPVASTKLLDGVPYAPFSKGDKLTRMADWTSDNKDRDGRNRQYNRNYRDQQQYGSNHAATFNAPPVDDESFFSVVTNSRDTGKAKFGRGAVFSRGGRGGQRGGRAEPRVSRQQIQRVTGQSSRPQASNRGGAGARNNRRFGWKDWDKPNRTRDASINIKPDWELVEQIEFSHLTKLKLDVDAGETLSSHGFVYPFDRTYDRQAVRSNERKLVPLDRASYNVTTSLDPIIQEFAEKEQATVFATDSILSMLMCANRSVYPWDIVIVRQGDKIFLDKRENAALDMVTVNETANDSPVENVENGKPSINGPSALAEEATYINHNFVNQVVLETEKGKVTGEQPNPFYNPEEDSDPVASKIYKYRRFDLSTHSDESVQLVVRTEIDSVQRNSANDQEQLLMVKALNEFDSKAPGAGGSLDWRTKLASQRGAVVATEIKNNSCKLARWTIQSLLSEADLMKLGFVSRANPRTNDRHVILGVAGWKPKDFAAQMNLNLSNGWGIVRTIVNLCLSREEENGKFVLIKDPNAATLKLYAVPEGGLDEESEDEAEVEVAAEAQE